MYYPQQSPGIAHKLSSHPDQSPWPGRAHAHTGFGAHPPPPSPAYNLYANGVGHLPHHMPPMHHHQNSVAHYPSPPQNGVGVNVHGQPVGMAQDSPSSVPGQIQTPHWQQQMMKYDMIRASRSPHHRARANAMASRTVPKSAIPITNPNKPPPEPNGPTKDGGSPALLENTTHPSPKTAAANANHPSSTVGPIARPYTVRPTTNTWTSLDMGGVQIKNLPATSGLFSFTFLLNLFLNHNALSSIPKEISKLKHLEVLDLSGNTLTTVPPELGLLTHLKELYLFDNHISTIPPELGTLHQLRTLGIEGNPIDASLKSIVKKEGTPALISFLRDSCPIPPQPPARAWVHLTTPAEREGMQADPNLETFSVLCYNVLCEKAATERLYGYTPSWALAWDYRKGLIARDITRHDADFLCLQEVDQGQYKEYFVGLLEEKGYEGVYWPKSRYKTMNESDSRMVDGCATFFKKSKYQLVEKHLVDFSAVAMQRSDMRKTDDLFNRVLVKDHIAVVCLFENRESGTRYIIANAHVHWDPQYCDVKLVQVALLVDEVEKIANNFAKYPPRPPQPAHGDNEPAQRPPPTYSDGTKIPLIICGDYNSVPDSGVYEYLSNGTLAHDHPDFMSHTYGRYTTDGLKHRFGLKSAYAGVGELPLTNYTPSFQGSLDYIWYSTANLAVNAVLGEVDKGYLEKAVGFPDAHNPSDHIYILGEFRVKPPRDPQAPRPPPVFPT